MEQKSRWCVNRKRSLGGKSTFSTTRTARERFQKQNLHGRKNVVRGTRVIIGWKGHERTRLTVNSNRWPRPVGSVLVPAKTWTEENLKANEDKNHRMTPVLWTPNTTESKEACTADSKRGEKYDSCRGRLKNTRTAQREGGKRIKYLLRKEGLSSYVIKKGWQQGRVPTALPFHDGKNDRRGRTHDITGETVAAAMTNLRDRKKKNLRRGAKGTTQYRVSNKAWIFITPWVLTYIVTGRIPAAL